MKPIEPRCAIEPNQHVLQATELQPRTFQGRAMPGEQIKIVVNVPSENRHLTGMGAERFWATCTDDGNFRIDNHPWFPVGLSFADVVAGEMIGVIATRDREVLLYEMTRVVRRSGWRSLVAAYVPPFDVDRLNALKAALAEQHAEIEHCEAHYMAVGVPPDARLSRIFDVLRCEEMRGDFAWLMRGSQ